MVLEKAFVNKRLTCITPMEISYYYVKRYRPVCFHCEQATDLVKVDKDSHPLCETCQVTKMEVKKCKYNMVAEKQRKKVNRATVTH